MKIYCTPQTEALLSLEEGLNHLHTYLDAFSEDAPKLVKPSTHWQMELFDYEKHSHYKLYWISARIDGVGRLTGAIVKDLTTNRRCFFGLEVTFTHHYQKTLVQNAQRKKNWRTYITDFLINLPIPPEEEAAIPSIQHIVQYNGGFKRPDAQQMELIHLPVYKAAVCFSSPGTGKTLTGVHRAIAYIEEGWKTLILSPTQRLAEATDLELDSQGIDKTKTGSACWSIEQFFAAMNAQEQFAHLNLVFDKETDTREYIDFTFFETWVKSLKKKNSLTINVRVLWQEFCYICMQPDWSHPKNALMTPETYLSLGDKQSSIPKDARKTAYGQIFKPFYQLVSESRKYYFPILLAHLLYTDLQENPSSETFDALVLDELQNFHPWIWASILNLLKQPLSAGQFFLCGDAHQGADMQALRIAEPLRLYFQKENAEVAFPHLSVNYRSAPAISRFVAQVHAVELAVLGSMERDTHVHTEINEHALIEGRVELIDYSPARRAEIAHNAEAYVLIPDESMRVHAESLWPAQQLVTVKEFTGMSAEMVVLFGFSDHFKNELKAITALCPEQLPSFKEIVAYARKGKAQGESHTILRLCLQALYTAASRAVDTLYIAEKEGRPHALFRRMV